MRNSNCGVWFWKNIYSGMIYKYECGKYPINHESDYRRVPSAEYDAQLKYMRKKYLGK